MGENCDFCKSKKLDQKKYLEEIKKIFSKYGIKEIPLFPSEIRGGGLEVLSKVLYEENYELPKAKRTLQNQGKASKAKFKFDSLDVKPNLDFLLFGGKGGVGKTSCASAVALRESKKRKVLIFSTDPAHSLSDSFSVKIGPKITKISNNLDALEIDSYALLDDLKIKYQEEIAGFFNSVFKPSGGARIDAPYDRKIMTDLFDLAPPGIDEIMALKTVMDLIEDEKNKGYELFILDTAPSGHTIRLLEMPEMAESWLTTISDIQESYPFSTEIGEVLEEMIQTIGKVNEVFTDPNRAEFVAVTIPEAMGLLETQDLIKSLKRLKISVESLIVNKIFPDSGCLFCTVKRSEQSNYIKDLQNLKLRTIGVELFNKEIRGVKNLEVLGEKLYG
jgi:arsenite/tail-anchored protein-transporting ATPase